MTLNNLQIIDPTKYPGWDDLLLSSPGYSFFQTSAWARVLAESYGYKPLYFTVIEDGNLRALVPFMEIDSILTGKRGVSLPFTDYCEPIVGEGISFKDLFDQVIDYGKKRRWKYIELRGGSPLLAPAFNNTERATRNSYSFVTYLGHTLDLTRGEETIFSSLRDSTRRNIRKAIAQGVVAKISTDLEGIKEFYRLNCTTRKKHGLPPQPYHFFQKIYDHIISKGSGFVILSSHNILNIAGSIFFHFGDGAIYKYGASDMRSQELRPNNLVMWEGIKWYSQNGYKSFCFGRTEPDHKGLIQFKSGWGAAERKISYYHYDFEKGAFVNARTRATGIHNRIFMKLPGSLLNGVGRFLYRHAG